MKYIEQLLENKKPNLWLYVPFTLFFLGIMFLNWLAIKVMNISSSAMIEQNIKLLGKNMNFVVTVAPLIAVFAVLLLWVFLIQKQSFLSLTTGRAKIDFRRVMFSFTVWGGISILLFVIDYLINPQNFQFNFQFWPFISFFIIAIILIPLQTSFEEYFLRGYLMQELAIGTNSKAVALIVTSLIFGLLHLGNPEIEKIGYGVMIFYIGVGFFLGVITLMDDGLELALGFHAANNLVTALLVTSNWTAFQTNSLFIDINPDVSVSPWEYLLLVGVLLPGLVFIFAKKYKWNNWNLHLWGKVVR